MVDVRCSQVSRTGRIRCKPLAFWANERMSRQGPAIERGFADTLTAACKGEPERPFLAPKAKAEGRRSGEGGAAHQVWQAAALTCVLSWDVVAFHSTSGDQEQQLALQ